ncbi:hypothetical protein HYW31_01150 [Candidatus Berkelbacteria bacterium]|nr:hypothetical protein [Candidatus Berkelbacteria bacterium]
MSDRINIEVIWTTISFRRAKSNASIGILLDADVFEELWKKRRSQIKTWQEVKKTLNWIKEGGKQDVNLAQFIYADRKSR